MRRPVVITWARSNPLLSQLVDWARRAAHNWRLHSNLYILQRKVTSEEKHQRVTQISSFCHKAMQLPVNATFREKFLNVAISDHSSWVNCVLCFVMQLHLIAVREGGREGGGDADTEQFL